MLFDLDGTISDSGAVIVACLRLTFAELGLPPLDPATERSLLGPPFRETMPALIGSHDVENVIAVYRRHYAADGAMYQTEAYAGIEAVLRGLVAAGTQLALATSKAEMMAAPILERLSLLDCFTHVCGDLPDGSRGAKALVVGEALRRFGHPEPGDVLMVGDRRHDVQGAAAHDVRTLGAGWGYGAAGELADAGAIKIFDQPADLGAYLDLR
jgi:phosphoglycolate phosphatase